MRTCYAVAAGRRKPHAHADIISHTGATPCTEICPFGLTETAVPVRLGEKTIGFLRIGQILRRSAILSDKARVAARLRECGVPFTGSIRKAWKATPIIPKDQYSAIVQLLTFFAVQLSTLINQIVLEKQNCEPPLVRKARFWPITDGISRAPRQEEVARWSCITSQWQIQTISVCWGERF